MLRVLQGLSDVVADGTRTITFSGLSGTGCSTLRGKFKVTKLTAVSWHGAANDQDSTTLSAAFFYIGACSAFLQFTGCAAGQWAHLCTCVRSHLQLCNRLHGSHALASACLAVLLTTTAFADAFI